MSPNLIRKFANASAAVLALGLFLGFGNLHAVPMIYLFSSTGSGSLGANSFSQVLFTIACTAETGQITNQSQGFFLVPDLNATIFVSGLGIATFTIPTENADYQPLPRAGFSDPTQNRAILFLQNPPFSNYDLSIPLGPLTGPPIFNFGTQFATTSGNFSLTSVSNVTFESLAIPQPRIIFYGCSQTTNSLIATNCISGAVYTVEGNTNLTTSNWVAFESVAAGGTTITNGVAIFSFTTASNTRAIYFRVYH